MIATRFVMGHAVKSVPSYVEDVGALVTIRTLRHQEREHQHWNNRVGWMDPEGPVNQHDA